MPKVTREDLPKRRVKLTIEVPVEEAQPFMEKSAEQISEQTKIPGFRPGKATYDVVKNNVGEMKILEGAIEAIVRTSFVKALGSENIESVGSPDIDMEKMAPGNPIIFTATVNLMPEVESLADLSKLKVEKKDATVQDSDLDGALKELQKMQTKEVRATSADATTDKDKAVIDLAMKKDNVPVDGGDAKNYGIYLSEPSYIPGFSEQIIGMKEGESKTFVLPFPKEHYQKHLAGSDVEFTVKLNELYRLDHPALDDAFAVVVGMKTLDELKDLLRKNIQEEKTHEENMRQERAVLDAVADASKFSDIPDGLVNDEVNKMLQEIEYNVSQQGMEFDTYLKSINKSIAQLKLDFTPQALQRIKVMLVLRALAKDLTITVDEKELDEELDKIAAGYEDKDAKNKIYSPVYREYMEGVMRNRKVIALLKEKIVK